MTEASGHSNLTTFNLTTFKPKINMSHITIKDLSAEDRPREKLLEKGVDALTVAELLAILIGGGSTKQTAVELMQDVMNSCDGKLTRLSMMTVDELKEFNGIGDARALTILAAAEIGRRRALEDADKIKQFSTGQDVFDYMQPRVRDLDHEESWAILLNNNASLLKLVHLSQGGRTETAVDSRVLMEKAILAKATCFILVHNHPSGKMIPSNADNDITRKVKQVGDIMNIRMLDHVIVSNKDYYSYAENGRL